MAKVDFKKEFKHLYAPSVREVSCVDVPSFEFLMVDGQGDPNTSQEYADAVQALYTVAYTLKFKIKKDRPQMDYAVMPLEGLWWVDDMSRFSVEDKTAWKWRMMIMQPVSVTGQLFADALGEAQKKKDLPALHRVKSAPFHEGPAAQIMYIGPYAGEEPTITNLHAFIRQQGNTLAGKHHEIYLSDPRKSVPDKLRTIIRQPFKH